MEIKNQIILDGTCNTRHLGSYTTSSEAITKDFAFIRTDAPVDLSQKDIDTLISLGVGVVIDLRYLSEATENKNSFENYEGVNYYHIPVYDNSISYKFISGEFKDISDMYIYALQNRKKRLAKIFKIIAEEQSGVMFHCAIGKDRTGIVACILLMLVGVSEDEILLDYSHSAGLLKLFFEKKRVESERLLDKIDPKELAAMVLESKPEFIKKSIDYINNNYGSAEDYLKNIGLTEDEIAKTKNKMLAN